MSEIKSLQQALAEREREVENLRRVADRVSFLEEQLKDSKKIMSELLGSTSWRFTTPLRALRRYFAKNKPNLQYAALKADTEVQLITKIELPFTYNESELLLADNAFDADFYRKSYPDTLGLDPFFHYTQYGKSEGRLPRAPIPILHGQLKSLDRSKATVLIVVHEASRTGAPVLALNIALHLKKKYNIIVLLLKGGSLLAQFQKSCDLVIEPFPLSHSPHVVSAVLAQAICGAELKFAIVNSIVSRSALPALAQHFVPSLCLIHEFASYTRPKNAIDDAVLWASEVVFSAGIVYKSAADQCEVLKDRQPIILPQGKCMVPQAKDPNRLSESESQRIREMFRPGSLANSSIVVILGAGFVSLRKGVDLFLACAARVLTLCPKNAFRFVWVGDGFDPDIDTTYSVYLQDQINQSGLEKHFCFTGEIFNIDIAYELSDVLFLSSRLDPLPNVAIDAMMQELPVICFDGTSGIADLLKENGLGQACVVPYLDVEQAAHNVLELIDNAEKRSKIGREMKELAAKLFDMKLYVDSLERKALDCVALQEAEERDCRTIENERSLVLEYYAHPACSGMSYKEVVRTFVRTWRSGIDLRKPFPGFHPGIYEALHGITPTQRNPLADFIDTGKPEGPWLCDLIQPSLLTQLTKDLSFRAALHVRVFLADHLTHILQRLETQTIHLDLLLSVPSPEVAEEVSDMVKGYAGGSADIRIVPKRGLDIGPLLTEFGEKTLKDYTFIGHINTSKSSDVKDSIIEQNDMFLQENLIGGRFPMASIIFERMAMNEKLGLVFPDDPIAVGWSGSKQCAEELAHQIEMNELPDRYFNFPVGNSFWARTEALNPLLSKDLKWDYYTDESFPYYATVPRALDRLLPLVAKKMGYQIMMTHIHGITI